MLRWNSCVPSSSNLVLIAATGRSYAISPVQPEAFIHSFERFIEMGSLSPLPAVSIYPVILARQIWEDRVGRALLFGGLWMGIVLLVWVSLLIPNREQVYLGFRPDASPGDQVPAPRLFLLPMVNSFFLVANTVRWIISLPARGEPAYRLPVMGHEHPYFDPFPGGSVLSPVCWKLTGVCNYSGDCSQQQRWERRPGRRVR